jgi:MFS transporter, DHA1 family, multidrug resistance protein
MVDIAATTDRPAQKWLGAKGMIALITLLSAFVPLSTDLYLPALPKMGAQFNAPPNVINLTLILFFITYSLGTLVWGPLSDKYGRRPVLLLGITAYIIASVMCANAWNAAALIVFRVLQAAGGSTAGAVATAIVKDVYDGRRRESILALVQSMVLITPAVAPMIGAMLLQFTSWRGVFWALALIGMLALAGCIALQETVHARSTGSVLHSLSRLGVVLQNKRFTLLLATFSLVSMASLAFIASSSYIYIDGFGLSEQGFSFFFAINAVGLILAPPLYLQLAQRFTRLSIVRACFAVLVVCGALVFAVGQSGPWVFALCLLPASIAGVSLRPPGVNLMLEQQNSDTGSAASLIASVSLVMGSLGMYIISLNWLDTIHMLGLMYVVIGLVCSALWWLIVQRIKTGQIVYPGERR